MKRIVVILVIIAALAACRGEPVPRDYQNAPPAMTHPPQTQSETPSAQGMGQAPPQPSTGVEGTVAPYEQVVPSTTETTATTVSSATSVENQPPVSTTT
jgi:hypothetical protein